MKKYLCLLIGIMVLPWHVNADGVLRCDNCSATAERQKVLGQSKTGYYYVFDMTEANATRYNLYYDPDARRNYVSKVETPQSLLPIVTNFIVSYNSYQSSINSNPNLLLSIANEVSGIQSNSANTEFSNSASSQSNFLHLYTASDSSQFNCSTDNPGDISVYDFMTNSKLRRDTYKRTIQYYPALQELFNSWNDLVKHTEFTTGGATVQMSLFTISQTVVFTDGASVRVVADPEYLTFNIVEGSAKDCNDNNIPLPEESLVGDYVFGSREDAIEFGQYTNYFGVRVGGQVCYNGATVASCNWDADSNRYSCNYKCQ